MRPLRRLSITWRITIGSLIVATLFGAVAVVGVRLGVESILDGATATLLRHDIAPFVETIEDRPGQPLPRPGESQQVAVVDDSGAVRLSTLPASLRDRARSLARDPAIADGSPHRVRTGKASYLVVAQPVATQGGSWTVVAARNDEANELVLTRLSIALIVGAIVIVLGFGLASWVLARTALQPVSTMRRQAERLASGGPDGLLPAGPAEDELFALANTLNGLILQLRASAEREKQLVSDASHELRTPLAVLQGELELAELDAGDADALLRDVRASHAAVLRLSALATNLLELSRIESGADDGRSSVRELADELAAATDRARSQAARAGEAITVDFEAANLGGEDVAVPVSAREFGRVLDNLLGNAVAAVERDGGSGRITATLERMSGGVVLRVVDDAAGVPPEFLAVAFDRFTRADDARSTRAGGGLGLAIVAAIVARADGRVAASNRAPHGFCVVVELPLT